MTELSISEVAERAGVSARMLRHYDKLGLFRPTRVSGNGYRWYDRRSLPRLHRIVALRRAGLGLEAIAEIVTDEESELEALRRHLVGLRAERDRIDSLIESIAGLIDELDRVGSEVPGRARFEREKEAFAQRLEQRFGPEAGAALRDDPLDPLTDADVAHTTAVMRQLLTRFADLMNGGHAPDSASVRALVRQHHDLTTRYWSADLASYRRLGALLESDPLQCGITGAVDPGLPAWIARAIEAYVDRREPLN
ncbi:MerR family transcriptional regulator [Arachnia propionica]|uniref:MerR family transcriptional regulator n=1 Tax=Arachnia propionica TaxID=1750 RepID=A0A3P1T9I1_9ACTN|nr:MerR family transcriptional regulator [Arachnia propionica]MDO5084280.1 MerR family transcriptional regulator [Arachnia propionica]RRD06039.1 MerR family transcriptional regulator [Arachnia propionica]